MPGTRGFFRRYMGVMYLFSGGLLLLLFIITYVENRLILNQSHGAGVVILYILMSLILLIVISVNNFYYFYGYAVRRLRKFHWLIWVLVFYPGFTFICATVSWIFANDFHEYTTRNFIISDFRVIVSSYCSLCGLLICAMFLCCNITAIKRGIRWRKTSL
jgi:hypothetical protein